MKNVLVTTEYVDFDKVADRNEKGVDKVDENTELAGLNVTRMQNMLNLMLTLVLMKRS